MVIGKKNQTVNQATIEIPTIVTDTNKTRKQLHLHTRKSQIETAIQASKTASTKVRLSADIEQSLHIQLKICSAVTGNSINKIIQELIRQHCPTNVAA